MLASVLRTIVPIIVGTLLGWAARVGLNLPEAATAEIVTVVATFLYYGTARLLEEHWPAVGRLLLSLGIDVGKPLYR